MVKLKRSPKTLKLDTNVAKNGQFHVFPQIPQQMANSAARCEYLRAVEYCWPWLWYSTFQCSATNCLLMFWLQLHYPGVINSHCCCHLISAEKLCTLDLFKPPPAEATCFRVVHPCVRPSFRDSRGSFMFPRYLQYLLTDFRQTFVTGASWDRDDLITFWGQKAKVQGHTIAEEAHSTRCYRRAQLFLVL